jgi:hypothetical protein
VLLPKEEDMRCGVAVRLRGAAFFFNREDVRDIILPLKRCREGKEP